MPIQKNCSIPSQNRTTGPASFCFGGDAGKGACFGDSGGPVMVEGDDKRYNNGWKYIH